jgi:hypothetical protein
MTMDELSIPLWSLLVAVATISALAVVILIVGRP